MSYLLDTNAVIALLRQKPHPVDERFRRELRAREVIAVSSIVLFELCYGIARSQHPEKNAKSLRDFLAGPIQVLDFNPEDAARAGEIRAHLEVWGTPIGPYDLLVAAQALRTATTLVTANFAEFARVPGLRWEDWSLPD